MGHSNWLLNQDSVEVTVLHPPKSLFEMASPPSQDKSSQLVPQLVPQSQSTQSTKGFGVEDSQKSIFDANNEEKGDNGSLEMGVEEAITQLVEEMAGEVARVNEDPPSEA